jgi:NitT/TauT family transport system substrate-binding protein
MTKRKEIAQRFMTAYLKGVRFYNDAIRDGHFAGPNAEELIDILVKETRYKDAALYKNMVPNGCDPDGKVDRPSLETDLAFWRANKFVEDDKIGVADVLDNSYVEAALKIVGPYTPA